jgi:hypothetical protein
MANDPPAKLERSIDLSNKVAKVFQKRAQLAQERFTSRVQKSLQEHMTGASWTPMLPWDLATSLTRYAVDAAQRWVLFWDTLRQRGNEFIECHALGTARCSTSSTRWSSTAAPSSARSSA